MVTQKETVRLLCKSIITRLENKKAISFPPRLRQIVQDEAYSLVGQFILTDEDLRERALARIGAKVDTLQESSFTESEQYKVAKSLVRSSFGDDVLNGLYFQRPLKTIASMIVEYCMRSSNIDDVFETDEDLEHQIVEIIRRFNPSEMH